LFFYLSEEVGVVAEAGEGGVLVGATGKPEGWEGMVVEVWCE